MTSFQRVPYGKEEKNKFIGESWQAPPQPRDHILYPWWGHVGSMNSSCDGTERHLISAAISPKPHNSILVIKKETLIQIFYFFSYFYYHILFVLIHILKSMYVYKRKYNFYLSFGTFLALSFFFPFIFISWRPIKNMPLYYSWKHSNPLKTGTSLRTVTV